MRIRTRDAARILEKSEQFIRIGLQRQLLPFGFAIKQDGRSKYDYFINPHQFAEYCGISMMDLKGLLGK